MIITVISPVRVVDPENLEMLDWVKDIAENSKAATAAVG